MAGQESSGQGTASSDEIDAILERLARARRLASDAVPHSPAWEALMAQIDALNEELEAARGEERGPEHCR
jgi:hypothetical protein